MKAWQAKHDDAALLAVADRLVAEHHDQSARAEEAHPDRQVGARQLCPAYEAMMMHAPIPFLAVWKADLQDLSAPRQT